MLDANGLIHMNGRVYDPTTGRFLSADIFIQVPTNSQSYNRYSYVMNNPLRYTDSSGYEMDQIGPDHYEVTSSGCDQSCQDTREMDNELENMRNDEAEMLEGADNNHNYGSNGEEQLHAQEGQDHGSDGQEGGVNFNFDQFANEIRDRRFDITAVLGTLATTLGVGTMPKTPAELRGLGVPKNKLNPYTGQLSRWSGRTGNRALRELGRTAGGVALGTAATGLLIFEGFYNWGVIGRAAVNATTFQSDDGD